MSSLQCAVINNAPVYYADSGGEHLPTVLLINSLGTDLRSWDALASRLPRFRIIRYDKRGHGLSPFVAEKYGVEQHAEDAHLLLSHLGVSAPLVCGVSIGGLIAPHLAVRRPLRGLVLCNSALRLGERDMWDERIAAVRAGGMEAVADDILRRWFSAAYRQQHGAHEMRMWRAMLVATPAAGYIASCYAVRDADNSAVAGSVKIPALCIAGAEDVVVAPESVHALCDSLAAARYQEIAGCGHLPHIECPAELAAMIKSFIEKLP